MDWDISILQREHSLQGKGTETLGHPFTILSWDYVTTINQSINKLYLPWNLQCSTQVLISSKLRSRISLFFMFFLNRILKFAFAFKLWIIYIPLCVFSLHNQQQKYRKIGTYKTSNLESFENIPGGRCAILLFWSLLQK